MPEGGVKAFSQAEKHIAEIAQLVEHNLAKVEVAGPSPVFRSENQQLTEMGLLIFLFAHGKKRAETAFLRLCLPIASPLNSPLKMCFPSCI